MAIPRLRNLTSIVRLSVEVAVYVGKDCLLIVCAFKSSRMYVHIRCDAYVHGDDVNRLTCGLSGFSDVVSS